MGPVDCASDDEKNFLIVDDRNMRTGLTNRRLTWNALALFDAAVYKKKSAHDARINSNSMTRSTWILLIDQFYCESIDLNLEYVWRQFAQSIHVSRQAR